MFNIVHSSGWVIAVFFTPLLLVWNVATKKKKRECMCHVLQIQMLIQALVYQIRLKPFNENSEC